MKIVFKIMLIALLMMSCQSDKKQGSNFKTFAEKQAMTQEKSIDASKDLKSQNILTEAQFKAFFPEQIGAYKLVNVSVLKSSGIASAMYIVGNDYNNSLNYSLEDGNRKGSAIIRNFADSYNLKQQGTAGTEYVYTERDNNKTIAFLQPQIKRNDIRFIYNSRFRLTLQGSDVPDTLWSYFKKEDLQKLDVY